MSSPITPESGMVEKLRQLLLDLYVSGSLGIDGEYVAGEMDRLYDTVLEAAEGRDFEPLGLPFPRRPTPTEGEAG